MARFHIVRRCPLCVTFWLLGLDAREGWLSKRGFQKTAAPTGSSYYQLGDLTLHSSGLSLQTPQGKLHFNRRTYTFTCNDLPFDYAQGVRLCRPYLLEHEAWMAQHCGPDHRQQQLSAGRLPPPVRRNVALWQRYVSGSEDFGRLRLRERHGQPTPQQPRHTLRHGQHQQRVA